MMSIVCGTVLGRLNVKATESRFEGGYVLGVGLRREVGDLVQDMIGQGLGFGAFARWNLGNWSVFVALEGRRKSSLNMK